jgi:hypothetical protein
MRIAPLLAAVFGILAVATALADLAGELTSARQRWADRGSDHYRFTISNGCYCGPAARGPVTVTVVDGEVSVRRASYLDPPVVKSPLHITIPRLFDWIDDALRRYPVKNFHLEFDPIDGHPTRFEYDDPAVHDDQTAIVIEDFEHL